MSKSVTKRPAVMLAGLLALLAPSQSAFAQASLLVWPIDPVIEADRGAGALWLENKAATAAVVQIRVFAWNQQQGVDDYSEQSLVVASPPMAQIAPGGRQLVRLTSPPASRGATETAYRIVVDEIPARLPVEPASGTAANGKAGVRFQMRYTIPLFVYRGAKPASSDSGGAGGLICAFGERDGRKIVTIRNPGPIHARVVDLWSEEPGGRLALPDGQLSYVLAGATMQWSLPAAATGRGSLSALVNGGATRTTLPGCARE